MRFLIFSLMDVSKVPDVSKASDKVWSKPPANVKILAAYTCQGLAFPNMPLHTILTIRAVEVESNETLSALIYPQSVAGATVWTTPAMDLPAGAAVELEKKFRG